MSIKAVARVWSTSNQTHGNLLVLLAMADYANEYGYCWASIDSLAKKSRLKSRRAVIDIQKHLAAAGEIVFVRQHETGTNVWQVVGGADFAPPSEQADVLPDQPPSVAGAENAPVQKRDADLHPIRKEPSPLEDSLGDKDPYGSGAFSAPTSAPGDKPVEKSPCPRCGQLIYAAQRLSNCANHQPIQ